MLPCLSSWLGCRQVAAAGARGLLFRHQALSSWEGCCHLAPACCCSSLLWIRLSSNEPKRGLNQHVRESLRMFCFLLCARPATGSPLAVEAMLLACGVAAGGKEPTGPPLPPHRGTVPIMIHLGVENQHLCKPLGPLLCFGCNWAHCCLITIPSYGSGPFKSHLLLLSPTAQDLSVLGTEEVCADRAMLASVQKERLVLPCNRRRCKRD